MGLYEKDLQPRVANVNAMLKVPVTQELFDALVSLTFNAGEKNLANSDLIKKLNAGNYQAMPSEFIRWVYTSKKKSLGLQIRRIKEMVSFAVPYIKK
ncbi:lysozyme RrrD [Deinococcus xinjiangensis]|uniref:Lysozyme n=2 Tax=Deinococcus xinjiangensis TaxID=457454 RepID=A0ABP9VH34_9DEIO